MATKTATKSKMEKLRRAKTSFELCSDSSFGTFRWAVRTDVPQKEITDLLKGFMKKNFTKEEYEIAMHAKDHCYKHYVAAAIYWSEVLNKELPEEWELYKVMRSFKKDILYYGQKTINESVAEDVQLMVKPKPVDKNKEAANATVLADLDMIIDEWIQGKKTSYDMYASLQKYQLKPAVAPVIAEFINKPLSELKGVINKEDDQLVEAYKHLNKREIARRISEMEKMISDLSSYGKTAKTVRKQTVRTKKPIASEKLVAKLKYKKIDNDFKIASVDPTKLIGAKIVYLFNTKYRSLVVLQSDEPMTVSGTSIKNFISEKSTSIKLRKPEAFLPIVLSKTSGQIEKELAKLTTKATKPNGRINEDMIILKVI